MTSMLFTERYEPTVAGCTAWARLHFLGAVAWRDLLFRRVFAGGLLGHLAHHRAVAGHERHHLLEPIAVPHLELDHARAFVVDATRLDGREESRRAQLLDASLGEIEVLESPAQLLRRHDLALAVIGLRDAKRLDDDDAVDHAARVHDVAEPRRILEIALVGAVHLGLDVLHHRKARPGRGERRADITLGGVAGRNHILFRSGPPDAQQLIARIASLSRRLQRNGAHHAVGPDDHVIALGLANLQ